MVKLLELGLYWIAQLQTLLYMLCAGALVIGGIKMIAGDDEDKAKARKNFKWVLLGAIAIAGATYFADEFTKSMSF